MAQHLVLTGPVPASDLALFQKLMEGSDCILHHSPDMPVAPPIGSVDQIIGYISFFPCLKEHVLELLSLPAMGPSESEALIFQKIDDDDAPDFLNELPTIGLFSVPLARPVAINILLAIERFGDGLRRQAQLERELVTNRGQMQKLITIATSLSSHNDLQTVLSLILTQTRSIVNADAASLYIREQDPATGVFGSTIRFMVSQNDSVDTSSKSKEFVIAIDQNTIAGYVAFTGKTLLIPDVYNLDESVPYKFGTYFEKEFGYRIKSMLTVPMTNLSGDIVGVLQLMNKKDDPSIKLYSRDQVFAHVISFDKSDEELILSVAAQAAVSVERAQLYESIQQLFEGYLTSSMTAIDERDRVTSGHSQRVAEYAMAFVDAINRHVEGPFKDITFDADRKRQFKFAAMLHDIGKIGVPEAILTKEKKLSKATMDSLCVRIEYIKLLMKLPHYTGQLPWKDAVEIDDDLAFLAKTNTSGYLADPDEMRLREIQKKYYYLTNGERTDFLVADELKNLSIKRGNLTDEERELINSHALATHRILSKIPWLRALSRIPDIAAHHHEKIDGSGYPHGLKGDAIPLESRILAAIDIYEALTAQDRPYKPAMPHARAIEILTKEVEANHLDKDIVDLFVSEKIYTLFTGQ